ncbi:MAG: sulfatase-like hydrolase/transferase [Planctomycetota bacterium]
MLLTFGYCGLHWFDAPVSRTLPLSVAAAYAWIMFQVGSIAVPILLASMGLSLIAPRLAWHAGLTIGIALPLIAAADTLVFHAIGQRFFSLTTWRIARDLLVGLVPYVSVASLTAMCAVIVFGIMLLAILYVGTEKLATKWSLDQRGFKSTWVASGLLSVVTMVMGLPGLWNWSGTTAAMAMHSTRHPWCVLGWIDYVDVGVPVPAGEDAVGSRLLGLQLAPAARQRIQQIGFNVVQSEARDHRRDTTSSSDRPPDMLWIVCESIRPELIRGDVMPNVHEMSQRGLHLRQHFSGGNASNLGMFSLVSGMEAIWFPKSEVRFAPTVNRLLKQAGYELGFFAGHLDWATFQMDAYVRPELYDEFEIEDLDWLETDQRAIRRTAEFLANDSERSPRFAMLFLYSTHAMFEVDPRYAIDQPAATKSYLIPFPPSQRQLVWNRYRNAARSIDAMLAEVLTDDRVIVFAGDHGESFLEDGTVGHGTRLSRYQNMTPAIIAGPGISPQAMDIPTMHADVLPTCLSALGIKMSQPDRLDGVDLLTSDDASLADRRFITTHYIGNEVLLIGPWTTQPSQPFGYRYAMSLDQWQLAPLNPVDASGLEWSGRAAAPSKVDVVMRRELSDWLLGRFDFDPTSSADSNVQWLAKSLQSRVASDRRYALEVARHMSEPDVVALVEASLRDDDESIRQLAAEVVIDLRRRQSRQ